LYAVYIAASVFLFEQEESFQAGMALIITELSLILSIWVKPYEEQMVSTMESLSLITTFCTFIACLLISHEEVATKTDMAVVFAVVGVNIAFVALMALLFLKDSGASVMRKVHGSELSKKISGKFSSRHLPRVLRRDQTQVQSIETSEEKIPQPAAEVKANSRHKSMSKKDKDKVKVKDQNKDNDTSSDDLYPVVPKRRLSDAQHQSEMGVTEFGSTDHSDEEDSTEGYVSSNSDTEELRPHDELRSMMHEKDDEIQELKLQLHTLQRHSRRLSRTSTSSTAATPVPPEPALQPMPPPPAALLGDSGAVRRDRSRPTAVPPAGSRRVRPPSPPSAPSEESRIIDREIRHGRLTDHVKSSANRGDLESFIAATCVMLLYSMSSLPFRFATVYRFH
jgi:hypothetical protein